MKSLLEKGAYLVNHFSGKKATAVGGAIAVIWAAMPAEVPDTYKFWATVGLTAALIFAWALEGAVTKPPKLPRPPKK